ncbi:hypothetical protein CDAR_13901 [Caerostris darwini]|uniref:Uncharacterized protein n=1 Tax=Caerostris darwini TaxID=1538125 RepID=A0AAV4N603_9ARAC|nr:hypothetical protein CDAR_13901 [Caerostris darwini]
MARDQESSKYKTILKDKIIQFCSKEITLITLQTLLFAVNCFLSDPPANVIPSSRVNRSSPILIVWSDV